MLTGGDLKADTLFSLWTPLRHTIVRLNDRETFPNGAFSAYWDSPEAYLQWIDGEHMEMFFDGSISREHVRDLSGSGDVHISLAPEGVEPMEQMLDNYIAVLKEQKKYYCQA